jgi:hypothetical protein
MFKHSQIDRYGELHLITSNFESQIQALGVGRRGIFPLSEGARRRQMTFLGSHERVRRLDMAGLKGDCQSGVFC